MGDIGALVIMTDACIVTVLIFLLRGLTAKDRSYDAGWGFGFVTLIVFATFIGFNVWAIVLAIQGNELATVVVFAGLIIAFVVGMIVFLCKMI